MLCLTVHRYVRTLICETLTINTEGASERPEMYLETEAENIPGNFFVDWKSNEPNLNWSYGNMRWI